MEIKMSKKQYNQILNILKDVEYDTTVFDTNGRRFTLFKVNYDTENVTISINDKYLNIGLSLLERYTGILFTQGKSLGLTFMSLVNEFDERQNDLFEEIDRERDHRGYVKVEKEGEDKPQSNE